ncbi:MAG TPA: hypothetical protein VD767_12285, partial [Thermomicrobiales bacterium]|nr:hypothetical protein [Thermomicrobiales bacterium]
GGLGSSMPSWLQQPPAWKREPLSLPDLPRTLPSPDDSVIDPASLIDIDDLPQWLQGLARAASDGASEIDSVPPDPVNSLESDEAPIAEIDQAISTEDASEGATLPGRPPDHAIARAAVVPPVEEHEEVVPRVSPPGQQSVASPWWLSDRALGLVLLGIILAMIYVVLAVSGVV